MRIADAPVLEELGLTLYERKALVTLAVLGVADARTVCREGAIPTSKIYRAMERLASLGLVEIQPTRPKMYGALAGDAVADRLIELASERAKRFAAEAEELRGLLAATPERLRGRQAFVDLALGVESHVKRHLIHLTAAKRRILSYLERGDLAAVEHAVGSGFPILRGIGRNAVDHGVDHRVVFGFSYQTAPKLVEFLRRHSAELRHVTGVRYSGELGHPFHVVDEDTVILPLDHPFVPDGRFASLLVRDRDLAQSLAAGFETLWHKAMRDLREVNFHPGSPQGSVSQSRA